MGNINRQQYTGIKRATGPLTTLSVPLKTKSSENITDQKKKIEWGIEYYFKLYSTQSVVSDAEQVLTLEELDEEPTLEELTKAIDCLANGKAPG